MNITDHYIPGFSAIFPSLQDVLPWHITASLPDMINNLISSLDNSYTINEGIAIHHTAIVDAGAILKPPVIIHAHCRVNAHAYLRGGVWLGAGVNIGPGCEVKSCIILNNSSIAHFNFVGDSIIGHQVNFEAGAVIANHFNERADKNISVIHKGGKISTGSHKFGAIVGDHGKVGANAVLSPGTLLATGAVVGRLELVDQNIY